MVVGVLEITLGIDAAHSLKEKRKVIKSLIERTRSRFHVAIAEVDDHDVHNRARIGVSAVSNDHAHANSILDNVLNAIEDAAVGRAEILDTRLEILHV